MDKLEPHPTPDRLTEEGMDWTPELEAARLDLCEFMVEHADDPHTLTVHKDLGRRMKEVEQALTILGDIANRRALSPPAPKQAAPGGEVVALALKAIEIADRLIERGYGMDTPKEWDEAYRAVADANALTAQQHKEQVGWRPSAEALHTAHCAMDGTERAYKADRLSDQQFMLRQLAEAILAAPSLPEATPEKEG